MADAKLDLRFSQDVHSIDAVKRAAYRISDQATCDIVLEGSDILVSVSPIGDQGTSISSALVDRFKIEVLDADLRLSISAETKGVRNTILSHVFSRTGLTDNE